ncbi:hypothetical protein BJ165DRAFT_1524220 [Panaeolus papilionaceus]|nr:hypothetical protein BJ165DRAFT_1524220 [Panaeolus papilionaceus]
MTNKSKNMTVLAFVDDISLVATVKDFKGTNLSIKDLMVKEGGVMEWVEKHNCTFGPEKFQLVDFSRRKKPKDHTKFLGIHIDQELRWKHQNSAVTAKAMLWASQIYRLTKNRGGVAYKNIRRLFIGTAIPRITYGIEVFDPPRRGKAQEHKSALEKSLDSVLGKVAVIIVGGLRSSPKDVAMAHTNLDPIKVVIRRLHAKAAVRLATLPKVHPLHTPVANTINRCVKHYPTPLHHLMHAFDFDTRRMEKINPHFRLIWESKQVTCQPTTDLDRQEVVEKERERELGKHEFFTVGS